jgi:hypothetical protein
MGSLCFDDSAKIIIILVFGTSKLVSLKFFMESLASHFYTLALKHSSNLIMKAKFTDKSHSQYKRSTLLMTKMKQIKHNK